MASTIAEKIRKKALELGFHKVGFAPAETLMHERDLLEKWLEKGFHGEMLWMAREPEKRTDPKLLFPQAKTVISVALNYYTPFQHEETPKKGKISRYAWGDDYHEILREKLQRLLEFIKTLDHEVEGKICVDTSPIMEKAWAVRAGLGWIGKHSNLITKDYGSWVFLGEILVNIEIEDETKIETDHCGSCTACINACPTGAIVEPYVVNSNLCISYATIELREPELPEKIKENLNGWLYGCDICQEVCPWNRFQKETEENRFHPRNNETSVSIDSILSMTHEQYIERFRRSPMKRAKLQGLKRNAEALKNSNQK
ncbi:MAG: epoxyqueuosine reductase [Pyrinomonadaceae bacterium]|nr:MAG: epoxyqueuosine reductase [Pyrinomonadaceae bacterium]